MEVLSPVGNKESLIAAIRCGADAVYFGMPKFNARQNAENFSQRDFVDAAFTCHKSGVKCYITLNVLIKNGEMAQALKMAALCEKCGVDGVIVQDPGLAALIKERFKGLSLHASTQMTANTPAALKLLARRGFDRVVLPREASLEQIKELCKCAKELNLSTEVFVHGALCMCVSGQCLMSAAMGGRSANRGLCAGPCRLPHKASGGTGYDLSLKDLCLIDRLKELKDAGVDSLKIEGRLKSPEYVAAATKSYRMAVDGQKIDEDLRRGLFGVFSRSGFTSGYFDNKRSKEMFGIRSGDDKKLTAALKNGIHGYYRHERQNVPVDMRLAAKIGSPAKLTCTVYGQEFTVYGKTVQPAQNLPTEKDYARSQLARTGGTVYYLRNFDADIEKGAYCPFLKTIKNDALQAAEQIIEQQKQRVLKEIENIEIEEPSTANTPKKSDRKTIIAQSKTAAQLLGANGIDLAVLPPDQAVIYNAQKQNDTTVAVLLDRAADDTATLRALDFAKENGINTAFCTSLSHIEPAKKSGFKIMAAHTLNIFNRHTLKFFEDEGVSAAVLSAELKKSELFTGNIPTAVFAYGRLPIMLCANCPLKNGGGCKDCDHTLTDRKGEKLIVDCDGGFCEILSSKITDIADREGDFNALFLRFYDETPGQVNAVVSSYLCGRFFGGENKTRALYKNGVL